MLRELKSLVIFGLVAKFLLPRWKRLALCLAVIIVAVYVEGEYMRFVQLEDEATLHGTIAWAILLKNLVIALAAGAAILPDAWRVTRLHRMRRPTTDAGSESNHEPMRPAQRALDTEPDDDPFAALRRRRAQVRDHRPDSVVMTRASADRAGIPLTELVAKLAYEDRANLAVTLELPQESSVADIGHAVRWHYHSKVRSAVFSNAKVAAWRVASLRRERVYEDPTAVDFTEQDYPTPTWNELIEGLASHLKVFDDTKDIATNEEYICQDIIVRALQRMRPDQRRTFFTEEVDFGVVATDGAPSRSGTKAPLRGVAVLGLAQAAGFSLYTTSAAALSALSGTIGVTLPFAAYTGLSSVLSFATGPIGWATMTGWLAWQLTQADWKKLLPAIVYLINARARFTGEVGGQNRSRASAPRPS